jgi:hypothetical protein
MLIKNKLLRKIIGSKKIIIVKEAVPTKGTVFFFFSMV